MKHGLKVYGLGVPMLEDFVSSVVWVCEPVGGWTHVWVWIAGLVCGGTDTLTCLF